MMTILLGKRSFLGNSSLVCEKKSSRPTSNTRRYCPSSDDRSATFAIIDAAGSQVTTIPAEYLYREDEQQPSNNFLHRGAGQSAREPFHFRPNTNRRANSGLAHDDKSVQLSGIILNLWKGVNFFAFQGRFLIRYAWLRVEIFGRCAIFHSDHGTTGKEKIGERPKDKGKRTKVKG